MRLPVIDLVIAVGVMWLLPLAGGATLVVFQSGDITIKYLEHLVFLEPVPQLGGGATSLGPVLRCSTVVVEHEQYQPCPINQRVR